MSDVGRPVSVYVCPTPCDEDCELNGIGCHQRHYPDHGRSEARPHGHWRDHDPAECERAVRELPAND